MSAAFPNFQINLDYDSGMFTLRTETWDEFVEHLNSATEGNNDLVEALIKKIHGGFQNLLETPPRNRQEAQANLQAGGIKSTDGGTVEYKLCPGHGSPMKKKIAQSGRNKGNPFWSCEGKDANGDYAWKNGTQCKGDCMNYNDGDDKYTSA